MKLIKTFDMLKTMMNILGGLTIGALASEYSWWIMILGIPHLFFMGYANYFRDEFKQLNNI